MPESNLLTDFQDLLKGISTGLVGQAQVEKGSRWLSAFAEEFPLAHMLLMNALYKEPKDVIKTLGLMVPALREYKENPHVLAYVGRLQAELRGKKK